MGSWFSQAKCEGMDPETFMVSEKETKKERAAKKICKGCPVRMNCLEFALETDSVGILAGTTYTERQLMVTMMPSLVPSTPDESFRSDKKPAWDESLAPSFARSDRIPTLPVYLLGP